MKAILFAILFFNFNAKAWGPTGHRVVAEIAQKQLTKTALAKCNEFLEGDSLVKVANWPDEIKSEPQTYSYTYIWHYTSWRKGQTEHHADEEIGDILKGIKLHIDVLKNKKSTREEKNFL